MTRAVFVVSKQPYGAIEDGETRLTRLLLEAAAESCSVTAVVLAEHPANRTAPVDLVEVPKPPLRLGRLLLASSLRRRSLIHCRFAPRALVEALEIVAADVVVARRVYMAQAALDAGRTAPTDRLVVLVDVLESSVLRHRAFAALEARRTERDERRCLRAADEVAVLSAADADEVAGLAGRVPRTLELVLPPAERPAGLDDSVAVFVGDRANPANAHAFAELLAVWPSIVRAAPRARLLVAGRPAPRERTGAVAGVELLGFVDDLDALWRSAGVLLAPVRIGGGVRVKILDAARHGVPVVGSPEAVGGIDRYLPVSSQGPGADFTAEAVRLLTDPAERKRRGAALFEANRELDARGFVAGQLAGLLAPSADAA